MTRSVGAGVVAMTLVLLLENCSGSSPSAHGEGSGGGSGSAGAPGSDGAGPSSETSPGGGPAQGGVDGGGATPGDSGSGSSAGGDGGPVLPQVENNGGGILTAPDIVTVTYDATLYTNVIAGQAATMITDLQAFDDGIMSSTWWATVTADYCGANGCVGQAGVHISIPSEPPGDGTSTCGTQPCYTDSAIGATASLKAYLSGLFGNGTLPAPTAQSLYVFYMPNSVTIDVDGELSCVAIGGYHDSLTVGALDVPYAIVPICDPETTASPNVAELTIEQTATLAASHEIVEATTDPHGGEVASGGDASGNQYLGWYLTSPANQPWAFFAGGEVADLCVDVFGLGQDRWAEGGYVYQRVWSNTNAAASRDPCVPTPADDVYFNAGPTAVQNQEIQVGVSATGSYPVVAFADGTISAWAVGGFDPAVDAGNVPPGILSFAPTASAPLIARNGSSFTLSITLDQQPPMQPRVSAGSPPFEPYMILSYLPTDGGNPTAAHFWPGFVLGSQ